MNKRRDLIEGIRMGSKPRIGIALSGGGVRGVAHLGVLKALNEAGIFPQSVSGSSAGAIAGTLYCCGYKPDEILDLVLKTNFFKFMRPAISWKGIFKIDVLESFYSELLVHNDFSKLKIPLTVVATNLSIGQSAYFSEGEIIRPLMASSCIPGIFDPITIDGDLYVDGGVLNNMPMDPLEGQCDVVIGVNCNHLPARRDIGNIKSLIERTVIMAMNDNVYNRKARCDFFIEPLGLARYGVFDIKKATEIFQDGYIWTAEQLSADKKLAALGSLGEGD